MPSIRTYLLRFLDETSRKRHIVKQVLCPPQILKVFDALVLADFHIFQMVRTDNAFDRLHAFLACRRDDAVLATILCTNFKQNTQHITRNISTISRLNKNHFGVHVGVVIISVNPAVFSCLPEPQPEELICIINLFYVHDFLPF